MSTDIEEYDMVSVNPIDYTKFNYMMKKSNYTLVNNIETDPNKPHGDLIIKVNGGKDFIIMTDVIG